MYRPDNSKHKSKAWRTKEPGHTQTLQVEKWRQCVSAQCRSEASHTVNSAGLRSLSKTWDLDVSPDPEMETCACHIGLILLMLYVVASTATRNDVSSPKNNVTFGLKGMFHLFWEWKPFSSNCSLSYVKEMRATRFSKKEKGSSSSWEYKILRMDKPDMNGGLSLLVKAECNNMTIDSLNRTVQLAPGDEGTSVENFSCVWHYPEHVKCTWKPGPNTPPNVNYRIFYWITDKNSTSRARRLYTQEEFWDLIETGRTCEHLSSYQKTIGCQFLLNKSLSDFLQFAMVVTDASRSIKPYIYYEDPVLIAKLKPPKIVEAYRTTNSNIYVRWNKSQDIRDIEYELLITSSSSKQNESTGTSASFLTFNALPQDTYTVKVRVKLSKEWLHDGKRFIWSDWSKEETINGKDDEKITYIIIPLVISAVVIIAVIFLLVHMEKLKVFICPQIPDPARIFPKDLQEWLKSDVNIIYNKPEKEEICPVYLTENSPTTKCV